MAHILQYSKKLTAIKIIFILQLTISALTPSIGQQSRANDHLSSTYERVFDASLSLLIPPRNGESIKVLETIEEDRRTDKKVEFSWKTVRHNNNEITQTIEIRSPSATYIETNNYNNANKVITLGAQPGGTPRKVTYQDLDKTFFDSLVSLVKTVFSSRVNQQMLPNLNQETLRKNQEESLKIIANWQPRHINPKSMAQMLFNSHYATNVQLTGSIEGDMLKGQIEYPKELNQNQKANETITRLITTIPAKDIPPLLGSIIALSTSKEFSDRMASEGIIKMIQEMATDLVSKLSFNRR